MKREDAKEEIKRLLPCREYLEKSKGQDMYCCPYCNSGKGKNGTGALKVYPKTNTWTCFACHKSGDILDLLQIYCGTDYNGALEMGANSLGLEIDKYSADDKTSKEKSANKEKTAETANKSATTQGTEEKPAADLSAYYKACADRLQTSPEAISYLTARGISKETAAACGVGYDPAADPAQSNHPEPRIIIPTTSSHYVGRSISKDTAKQFQKMNNKGGKPGLFNLAALYSGNSKVFITEGAFDAMSVQEVGAACIALNSTSNWQHLIDQLKADPVDSATVFVVCLDNDSDPNTAEKTRTAANNLNSGLLALGYESFIFNIAGDYKDANEALCGNMEQFKKNIEAAKPQPKKDDLSNFLDKIQTTAYKPISTGSRFIDDLLGGGVISQSLLLLMAAPAAGKTTLCQQIAEEMAAAGKQVIYLNFEMSQEQMLAKAISYHLARKGKKKSATEILQGYNWTDKAREEITEAVDQYRKTAYPYIKYNVAGVTTDLDSILNYLHTVGENAKKTGQPAPAVIIDYLHLITYSQRIEITELIKKSITGLKDYAKSYDTFVIGIVATNRSSNGKITMDSGRDSSNIEYTGDYILSLNYYDIDNGKVDIKDLEKIEQLEQEAPRRMIVRVLKGRFIKQGRKALACYDSAHNIFYGENEWFDMTGDNIFTHTQSQAEKPGDRKRL